MEVLFLCPVDVYVSASCEKIVDLGMAGSFLAAVHADSFAGQNYPGLSRRPWRHWLKIRGKVQLYFFLCTD